VSLAFYPIQNSEKNSERVVSSPRLTNESKPVRTQRSFLFDKDELPVRVDRKV